MPHTGWFMLNGICAHCNREFLRLEVQPNRYGQCPLLRNWVCGGGRVTPVFISVDPWAGSARNCPELRSEIFPTHCWSDGKRSINSAGYESTSYFCRSSRQWWRGIIHCSIWWTVKTALWAGASRFQRPSDCSRSSTAVVLFLISGWLGYRESVFQNEYLSSHDWRSPDLRKEYWVMWTISLGEADARDGYHHIRNTLANLVSKITLVCATCCLPYRVCLCVWVIGSCYKNLFIFEEIFVGRTILCCSKRGIGTANFVFNRWRYWNGVDRYRGEPF